MKHDAKQISFSKLSRLSDMKYEVKRNCSLQEKKNVVALVRAILYHWIKNGLRKALRKERIGQSIWTCKKSISFVFPRYSTILQYQISITNFIVLLNYSLSIDKICTVWITKVIHRLYHRGNVMDFSLDTVV